MFETGLDLVEEKKKKQVSQVMANRVQHLLHKLEVPSLMSETPLRRGGGVCPPSQFSYGGVGGRERRITQVTACLT